MMWAVMGVGMLIQTFQNASASNQANQFRGQLEQDQAAFMKQFRESQGPSQLQKKEPPKNRSIFNFEGPTFPEQSYKELQNKQMEQAQRRQEAQANLQQDLSNMKNEFFANNHYETAKGPDGKNRVQTDENGHPKVAQGAENSEQKLCRAEFESARKAELNDKHAEQKQNFVNQEKQNFKEFLGQNREQLGNPFVHGELQKMVVDSKKKSLQLQQSQEDERWKVDLPPEQKIALRLEQGINDLHQMDRENIKSEEQSSDAQALMDYDKKVAAILTDQKDLARQEKKDEEFLMDPRKMMAARSQQGPKDVGESLPAYLTAQMYDLGIYTV